jgi:hypothetical protein
MLRLVQAGLIAGCIQAMMAAAATIAIMLSLRHGLLIPVPATAGFQTEPLFPSTTPLLTWIDLLTALGVALTGNRFVDRTAIRLRQASRRLCPKDPDHAARALLVQLWIATACFAVLALRSPPVALIQVASGLGCAAAASFVWPGMMSIGVAVFGANAQAAAKAL